MSSQFAFMRYIMPIGTLDELYLGPIEMLESIPERREDFEALSHEEKIELSYTLESLNELRLLDPESYGFDIITQRAEQAAVWTREYINDLPDSAFAVVLSGGKKDRDGRTTPRDLRMLPHHTNKVKSPTENASVDMPHLRNAMQRCPQTKMSSDYKARAMGHLQAHYKSLKKSQASAGSYCNTKALDPIRQLNDLYVHAQANYLASSAIDLEKFTVVGESVKVQTLTSDDTAASNFWSKQREKLGLIEDHTNVMFVEAVLCHVDEPNANGHILPKDEVKKALPTLILQPIDVAAEFDRHARERLWDVNGIRGVIYGARLKDNALEIGIVIWAYDFPGLAEDMVTIASALGASFDLLASERERNDKGMLLKGITFLGGAILLKHRAADGNTETRNYTYKREKLASVMSAIAADAGRDDNPMETKKDGGEQIPETVSLETYDQAKADLAAKEAELAEALKTSETQASEIETLKSAGAEMASKLDEAVTIAETEKARGDAAETKLEEIAEAQKRTELVDARMSELRDLAEFESPEVEAEMKDKVAVLSDLEFEIAKRDHTIEALKRGKTEKSGESQSSVLASINANGAGRDTLTERLNSMRALGKTFVKEYKSKE